MSKYTISLRDVENFVIEYQSTPPVRNRELNAQDVFELRTATGTGFETKGDVTGDLR